VSSDHSGPLLYQLCEIPSGKPSW